MQVLVAQKPREYVIEEAPDLTISVDQVLVKTLYTNISHGTEMHFYRGTSRLFHKRRDPKRNIFVDSDEENGLRYPLRSSDPGAWYMGYGHVGKVMEIGRNVSDCGLRIGDRVFANKTHQTLVKGAPGEFTRIPDDIPSENAAIMLLLKTAYTGILDTRISLGDTVVVIGLGMVGQLVVQLAKMSGALEVIALDAVPRRLEAALQNGADKLFDVTDSDTDVALAIRDMTRCKGPDSVIEVSGNPKALQEAIRIASPNTRVTVMSFYQDSVQLDLSCDFHSGRISLQSCHSGGVIPELMQTYGPDRKKDVCVKLLSKLCLDNLFTHRIKYENIADAYKMIDEGDPELIATLIEYE